MPTKKPRLNVVLEDDDLKLVEVYCRDHGIKSMSKGIRQLVLLGLNRIEDSSRLFPNLYDKHEMNLLYKYRRTTPDGQNSILSAAAKAPSTSFIKLASPARAEKPVQDSVSINDIGIVLNWLQTSPKEVVDNFIQSILNEEFNPDESVVARSESISESDSRTAE